MAELHRGSCQCKQVQFEVIGEFKSFYLCHCSHCRKDTGSAHSANLFAPKSRLDFVSGESLVRTYQIPSTRHMKGFCSECGSALPTLQMNGSLVVVPAGSLDTALMMAPTAHIFCASRADWDRELDQVREFPGLPD